MVGLGKLHTIVMLRKSKTLQRTSMLLEDSCWKFLLVCGRMNPFITVVGVGGSAVVTARIVSLSVARFLGSGN